MRAPWVRHHECDGAVGVHHSVHLVDDLANVSVGRLGDLEEPLVRADGHNDELWSVAKGELVDVGSRGV